MDDGLGGDFQSIIGFDSDSLLTTYTITTGIQTGRQYRLRYRAKNLIGWGSFSPEVEVLAATVPQPPGRPLYKQFSSNQLVITIQQSTDNGGSAIQFYELWVDQGDNYLSTFRKLADYDGISFTYYATALTDGLVLGKTYRFQTRSKNGIGYSDFSDEGYIAFANVPNTPSAPILTNSTQTSISVQWSAPA